MASSAMGTPKSSKFCDDGVSKVRVIVRVRPFLPREIGAGGGEPTSCVSVLDQQVSGSADEVTVHLKDQYTSRNECFKLDSFFDQKDNNVGQIFQTEVSPLVPGIFQGCNATVFAYGATGSGKTYTMQGSDELPGLMPLAMSSILSMCQSTGRTAEISYYEVYMDRCYDLLELKPKEIAILDDKDGQIHLKGLSRVRVNSMSEFSEVFSCGIQRRKVAHTNLNDVSSRSHGVLVIAVSTPSSDGTSNVVNGKLNLIDLAGNEDNRRTCNEGIRLQESAKINQSLFALSNVIYALNNNRTRVPYRESKLTRILQDSLGGTSRALMVACLNPGEYQESVHTVSLAARSRHISNSVSSAQKQETPMVKVDMEAKLLAWLEAKGKTKSVLRKGVFGTPFLGRTPISAKSSIHHNTSKAKRCVNRGDCNAKERTVPTPSRNLFNSEDPVDHCLENLHLKVENKEDKSIPDEKSCVLQTSSRKALSPISCNVKKIPSDKISTTGQSCSVSFELETPSTPSITHSNNEFQTIGTPLDKFHARASNLKRFLIQEYIDFLNTANKEELVDLKGIGSKRADYIVELRETSPLQSLRDLEKIGLSSKEVHNMFSSAARGILDRSEDVTTLCC